MSASREEPASIHPATLLREQESLREVIESISSELELRPLLTRIVRHACELLDAENGTIGLVDEERNMIRTEAVYRMPVSELGAEMAPGIGLAGQVLRTQQAVILNRYGDVEQPTQPGLLENAVIGMPIFWRGRMTGFFGLGSAPPRRFTPRDAEVLTRFGKHAAIAIENARLFTRTQDTLAEMSLLYETSRRISTAMDIEEVVAAYLGQVAVRGRYGCSVALYECTSEGQRETVVVRGSWFPNTGLNVSEVRFPYTRDALDPLLDAGQTVMITDVHSDSRVSEPLRAIQREARRPALAMVPLMVRGQRIGLVILSYPLVHAWREADLRPYEATAAQLATAIDSRRQQLLVYERGQELAVLEERQRIARDLHDSVTQQLFSLTLFAQSITDAWKRDPGEGEQRVERVLELSRAALAEMRALLSEWRVAAPGKAAEELRGIALVRQEGLRVGLRRHLEELKRDGLRVHLSFAMEHALPEATEEALFRITQEALNNVVKHAQSRQAEVRLFVEHGAATLEIEDFGIGFIPECESSESRIAGPGSGMGLPSMRERAEELAGTLRIVSIPGKGTTVRASIPLTAE